MKQYYIVPKKQWAENHPKYVVFGQKYSIYGPKYNQIIVYKDGQVVVWHGKIHNCKEWSMEVVEE